MIRITKSNSFLRGEPFEQLLKVTFRDKELSKDL